jgi:hypothetical protein
MTPGAIRTRRWRAKAHEPPQGSFEITETLVQCLVWRGEISEAEGLLESGANKGVAIVLDRYIRETQARFL